MPFRSYLYAGIAMLILGLTASLYYYKAEAAANEVLVAQERAAKETSVAANASLKTQLLNNNASMNAFVGTLEKLSDQNARAVQELQHTRAKMAQHQLLKLRNSTHSELVLKIINRSIIKKHKEWADE